MPQVGFISFGLFAVSVHQGFGFVDQRLTIDAFAVHVSNPRVIDRLGCFTPNLRFLIGQGHDVVAQINGDLTCEAIGIRLRTTRKDRKLKTLSGLW